MSLMYFTHCQAERYEMSSDRAAAVIEPVAATASSNAILLGPSVKPFAKVTRMRRCGIAMSANKRPRRDNPF